MTNPEPSKPLQPTTSVVFWFGVKGAEKVREPLKRGKKPPKKRGVKSPPDSTVVPVTGVWKRRYPGYFLSRALQNSRPESAWLKQLVTHLWEPNTLRKGLASLEMFGLYDNVEQVLLVARLACSLPGDGPQRAATLWAQGFSLESEGPQGEECGAERESPQEGVCKELFFPLAVYLKQADFVLPWGSGKQIGWLVSAPDELTAACWELVLMTMHGIKVKLCRRCGSLYRGRACAACKERGKKKRTPTERSRFLNLLAQDVRRGKITPVERERIKGILQERGLEAAMKARQRLSPSGRRYFAL